MADSDNSYDAPRATEQTQAIEDLRQAFDAAPTDSEAAEAGVSQMRHAPSTEAQQDLEDVQEMARGDSEAAIAAQTQLGQFAFDTKKHKD